MKTFLTRTLPLLLCIAAGAALSWVSIFAFWFAVQAFHTLPAVRACEAMGDFILFPAKWIFEWLGGDQTTMFTDTTSFVGTNGLILGILLYCVFRAFYTRWEAGKTVKQPPAPERRLAAKIG